MGLGNFVDIKLRFIFQYLLLSNIETKPNWKWKWRCKWERANAKGRGQVFSSARHSYRGYMYMHNRSSHIELYTRPIWQWFHGTRFAFPHLDPPLFPWVTSVRFAFLERKPNPSLKSP